MSAADRSDVATDNPKAADADPAAVASEIIRANQIDGLSRIRFWGGRWWRWSRGRYVEIQETELRAIVMTHFKRDWSHVKREHVANVIEHLRADLILLPPVVPPAWLGTGTPAFAVSECFATANRIVHLPSWTRGESHSSIPATPELFSLTAADFDLDLDAPAPAQWLAFLNGLWPDDPESIATLQEIFGYLLTGDTSQQKLFGLIGPTRSGKGTIMRVLRKIVGDNNVAGPTLSGLASHFGLAPIVGKSIAVVSDLRLSGRVDSATVVERLLAISGEDKVTVDLKHLAAIHCQLRVRFFILSNELPRLLDASGTIITRFILLRTTQSFLGREDTELGTKLDAELPGILLWAAEGWARLNKRGHFVQPASGRDWLENMTELASPIRAFVQDCCTMKTGSVCPKPLIFDAYVEWCKREGIDHPTTAAVFGRDLISAFPEVSTVRRQMASGRREHCYSGVELNGSSDDELTAIGF
jgi:putative DNA primase/helicase